MNKEVFLEEIKKLNIKITEEIYSKLEKYYELLIEYNQKINLTNITKKEEVFLKHFYDSLTLIKTIDLTKTIKICDIGTGAGFPGLVLSICFPNLKITLVDSLKKRTAFLEEVIKILNIKNVEVITSRAEEYAKKSIEKYDVVTCRAVSKLGIISEISIPLLKIDGYFIPMKANIEKELENIKELNQLDSKLEKIETFQLPIEKSKRNLIVIKKIKQTKKTYPRKYDQIKKKPLF